MKRQAIELSLEDILKLERLWIETMLDPDYLIKQIGLKKPTQQKMQFNIINKHPECSDTWKFEK